MPLEYFYSESPHNPRTGRTDKTNPTETGTSVVRGVRTRAGRGQDGWACRLLWEHEITARGIRSRLPFCDVGVPFHRPVLLDKHLPKIGEQRELPPPEPLLPGAFAPASATPILFERSFHLLSTYALQVGRRNMVEVEIKALTVLLAASDGQAGMFLTRPWHPALAANLLNKGVDRLPRSSALQSMLGRTWKIPRMKS